MRTAVVAAWIAAMSLGAAALAGGGLHEGDVGLFAEGGAVRTGTVTNQIIVPNRVFDADLQFAFGEVFTEDPGFISRAGAFAPFSTVRIDLVGPLRVWSGGTFDQPAAGWLEIEFGSSVAQSGTADGQVVAGPVFAVDGLGELHNHPFHYLVNAGQGVYLLQMRVTASSVAQPSDPFYFVYNYGRPQAEQSAAIQWVVENLLAPPCPADLSGDGLVNSADLASLLGAWGVGGGPADLSGDGIVNSVDLAQMLGAWGACP